MAERQQGALGTKHPGTQAKKEQETPRSNKSWRQVKMTPQPKERTGQRTVTPQEEGEDQEREREGAGDGRRKRWRKATRKEKSHGERPAANQKCEMRRDEMEENPSRRTTEGLREPGKKMREIRQRRRSPLRLEERKARRGTKQKTVKVPQKESQRKYNESMTPGKRITNCRREAMDRGPPEMTRQGKKEVGKRKAP